MLIVTNDPFMLSVVILSVIMLSVMAPLPLIFYKSFLPPFNALYFTYYLNLKPIASVFDNPF